jgi:hypothetical protein
LVPAEHCELNIAALNYEPVYRVVGNGSADLASKFLKRGHVFFHYGMLGLLIIYEEPFDIK